MPRPKLDPVTAYARSVVAGKTVAGRLVRLACERHLRDLKEGGQRGLIFSADDAQFAIDFFGCLRLAEGEFEGKPFKLEPFQEFIVGSLWGWKGADGHRRFRTAYVEQGKGNGKSPLAGGIGLLGLVADGEAGAEIYSAATTRDQASILFRDARNMADASPDLKEALDVGEHNIAHADSRSFFRPVSSEHRGLDGKRVHVALIDELHEHPSATVVDKMRAGTKGRRQALIFEITNSGYDRTSVCWQHHQYSVQVLEGVIPNDSWFAYVCQLDPCKACVAEGKTAPTDGCPKCDGWRDEKVWPKANPNLGVSVTHKYLREQVAEAEGMPGKENIVKRLNFCMWTEAAVHAIPMDRWDACAGTLDTDALAGRDFYGGLDLGATSDFTAFIQLYPDTEGEPVEVPADPLDPDGPRKRILRRGYTLVPHFWLPERPRRRDPALSAVVEGWRRQKLIRTTAGDVVDYDVVLADILQMSQRGHLRKLGFDRGFQGVQMGTNLLLHLGEDRVCYVSQGILAMNGPFRELIELIMKGKVAHAGHPVMRWHCSNCAAEVRGGLIKPSKDHSKEKIDGVTAAVMALAIAMSADEAQADWYTPGCLAA
jgi:phage terminase large subunit-like protein